MPPAPPPAQQAQAKAQGGEQRAPAAAAAAAKCPPTGWQYVDPKGNIQGPFTLLEMQLWNSMGYFRPDLKMRWDPADQFVEFNRLFPPPLEPFVSYPRRSGPPNGAQPNGVGGR